MNQAQVDYAALRFKSAKDLSSVANDIKSGRVAVETVYVERLGKRIMKFRCPPGTRRGGQWTDRLGTDCNLGPARAGLAKITRTVSRIDNALEDAEKRKLSGGPGLVRYQAGRAAERAGEIVDYAAQRTREGVGRAIERTGEAIDNTADAIRKRGQATRVRMGRALEAAGEAIDRAAERLGEAYERTKERVGVALERAGEAWDDRADRRRGQQAVEKVGNLLSADEKARAIEDLADQLHEAWRQTRKNPDGTFEPRLKDDGNGGQVDIANTRYKDLPEKWQAENKAAATHVIDAIDSNPNASDDEIAAMVHDAWLERNGEWAPDELKVDYADLPQDEKDKDLAIVEQARANIAKQKAASAAKKPDTQKPTAGPTKQPKKKQPKTVDPEKAQAELEKLQPNLKKPKPEDPAPEAESIVPEDTFIPAPPDAELPEADVPEANAPEVDTPLDEADAFVPAPPDASPADLPEPEKQPIPEPDSGKVPTAERTVIKKPEDGKKPSGPSKAAGASLDDANAKNAKKTKKKLPGKQYGSAFKIEENAKKWASEMATEHGKPIYVAKGPDGKYRIFDEEMFLASGHEMVVGYNEMGGVIDIPSVEAGIDATPEEIIEQVNQANLEEKIDLIDDLNPPVTPPGQLELKKSKTGQFLPDDFSPAYLDEDGKQNFATAWNNEVGNLLQFWEDRVGPISDPDQGLQAIDDYIDKAVAEGANPGKMGVLNAERNNFLAMVFPHPSSDDNFIDAYERINFVGPTRRAKIIGEAGLSDLLVGKKKAKAGETKKIEKEAVVPGDNVLHVETFTSSVGNYTAIKDKAAEIAKQQGKPVYIRYEGVGNDKTIAKIVTEEHIKDQPWNDFEKSIGLTKVSIDSDGNQIAEQVPYSQVFNEAYIKSPSGDAVSAQKALVTHLQPLEDDISKKADKQISEMLNSNWADYTTDGKLDPTKYEKAQAEAMAQASTKRQEIVDKIANGTVTKADVDELIELITNSRALYKAKGQFHDDVYEQMQAAAQKDTTVPAVDTTPVVTVEENIAKVENIIADVMKDDTWVASAKHDFTMKWDNEAQLYPDFADEDAVNAFFDAKLVQNEAKAQEHADALQKAKESGIVTINDIKTHVIAPEHRKAWLEAQRDKAMLKLATQKANPLDDLKDLSEGDKKTFYLLDADGDATFVPSKPDGVASVEEIVQAIEKSAGDTIYFDGASFTKEEAIAMVQMGKEPEKAPTPVSTATTASGLEAAFSVLFEADLGDFDYGKLLSYEDGKITDIASMQSRFGKYGKRLDDYLSKLPDNFDSLSTEEKLAALRTATGTADNKRAAIEFSRAAFAAQYGRDSSLKELNEALQLSSGNLLPAQAQSWIVTKYGKDVDVEIEKAKADLTAAQEMLDSAGYVPEAVLNAYRAKINDAKARLATASIYKYQQVKNKDNPTLEELAKAGQEMAKSVDLLDQRVKGQVEKAIYNGVSVEKGAPGNMSAKGMLKPASAFDSSLLGTAQSDGKAIAHSIPIGHKGIWTDADAANHLATGGKLSDIPDALLVQAIDLNTGKGKRFTQDPKHKKGFNESYTVIDSLTNQRYVVKESERNHMEHIQEAAGALLMQKLGFSAQGIRFGSDLHTGPIPAEQQKIEGVKQGLQRTIVIDTAHNFFGGQVFGEDGLPTANADGYTIYGGIGSVPKGADWDGESLARMMVLDRSAMYIDRTAANMIAVKGPDGKVRLHPFDHGNAFRAFDPKKVNGQSEQQIGFTQITKSDNVDLMALVSKLSPEEREAWASALADSVERYKKTNFEAEFTSIASTMKLSNEELQRLKQHATFLEKRKADLDWESMMKTAMSSAGIDGDAADDFIAGGHKVKAFKLPQDTKTVGNSVDSVSSMPARNAGFSLMFDGDDIVDFHVMAREVKVQGMPTVDGSPSTAKTATQFVFKLNPETMKGVDLSDFKSWTGHKVPKGTIATGATWKFDSLDNAPGSSNVQTMYKVLPDGSLVMITKGPDKHGMTGTVRILIPGSAKETMSDKPRVDAAMAAAGVKEYGLPSAKQVQEMGLRQLGHNILGKTAKNMTTDQIEAALAAKGFAADDIELVKDVNGSPTVRLTREATDRLMKDSKLSGVYHKLNYGSSGDAENKNRVISVFTSGTLASTNRRYEHGIHVSGWSSDADAGVGSSDHLFFRPGYDNASFKPLGSDSMSVGSWHWVGAGQPFYSNINMYTTDHDSCGNTDDHVPWSNSIGSGHGEIMVRSAWRQSTGITIVPETYYDEILEAIKSKGVTEIDGIPIEQLLATPSTAAAKGKALVKVLKDKGVIW